MRRAMMACGSMALSRVGNQIVHDRGGRSDVVRRDHAHRYNVVRARDDSVGGHRYHWIEVARCKRVAKVAEVVREEGLHQGEIGAQRGLHLMLTRSFYNQEKPELTELLCEELPGIFNWALDGLHQLRSRGRFLPPATSKEAIQALEDLASPVGAFMRDRCTIGPDLSVQAGDLYQAYRLWCDEHGRHAVNQQLLGRDLRAVRPEVRVRQLGEDRRRHYVGICLGTHATYA